MNSWAGPSTMEASSSGPSIRYRAMVVDSGPIIKETNVAQWMGRAEFFYTVPAVIAEIRDAKARHQLQQQWIPILDLKVKEPSASSVQRIIEFSKLTGDYPSLSSVDLQVLALVLDLEQEGCLCLDHLRTTPKRMIGLGAITTLQPRSATTAADNESGSTEPATVPESSENHLEYDIVQEDDDDDDDDESESENEDGDESEVSDQIKPSLKPPTVTSWAKIVNPKEASDPMIPSQIESTTSLMATMKIDNDDHPLEGGQWDDAEDDPTAPQDTLTKELQSEFPSLAAAATVPYEDDEGADTIITPTGVTMEPSSGKSVSFQDDSVLKIELENERRDKEAEEERRKQEALKPLSKSGKLYNSFRKYGHLMKPAPPKLVPKKTTVAPEPIKAMTPDPTAIIEQGQSRILGPGGSAMVTAVEDMKVEDDDGEGWITSTRDIRVLKNHSGGGPLDPIKGSAILAGGNSAESSTKAVGPPKTQRAACTTTDFAMQNVLLQMGLVLLSVDGMQIRRLKSWVLRCGACFKIHTDPVDPITGLRRMFCAHCGSDMVQRVSASVDAKTGRLKLFFSKKKQNKHTSARGTKFSLPKPGTGNRFQGDLLLREDQLLMGAWNQKVKKNSGGQAKAHAQSIFGKDIASNIGCQATSMPNDIQVGFGRRNPNAAKGRERRGKKKKSSDRACGLRRY